MADNLPAVVKPAFLQPNTFEDVAYLAERIGAAGWVPKGYLDNGRPNLAKIEVGIMHGREIGLGPMAALQSIAVINGMPSLWGDGMMAVVLESGLLEDMVERFEGEGDARSAVCIVKRRGRETMVERRFTISDAKRAGLWGKAGPWTQYPQRMMPLRARGWALRDTFADVLKGMASAEEMVDMVEGGPLQAVDAPPRPTRMPQAIATPAEPEPQVAEFDPIEGEPPAEEVPVEDIALEVAKEMADEQPSDPEAMIWHDRATALVAKIETANPPMTAPAIAAFCASRGYMGFVDEARADGSEAATKVLEWVRQAVEAANRAASQTKPAQGGRR